MLHKQFLKKKALSQLQQLSTEDLFYLHTKTFLSIMDCSHLFKGINGHQRIIIELEKKFNNEFSRDYTIGIIKAFWNNVNEQCNPKKFQINFEYIFINLDTLKKENARPYLLMAFPEGCSKSDIIDVFFNFLSIVKNKEELLNRESLFTLAPLPEVLLPGWKQAIEEMNEEQRFQQKITKKFARNSVAASFFNQGIFANENPPVLKEHVIKLNPS